MATLFNEDNPFQEPVCGFCGHSSQIDVIHRGDIRGWRCRDALPCANRYLRVHGKGRVP